MTRAGGTLDDLTRLLLHPDHEGGRHARHIAVRSGQAHGLGYIHRVWASVSAAVTSMTALESRQHAHEALAALRDRIETTPWRGERGRIALRVLRAHLTFAKIAGGPLHHASERQAAEEAGISRTTLRICLLGFVMGVVGKMPVVAVHHFVGVTGHPGQPPGRVVRHASAFLSP
ncbi:hypothetical protein [Streptomyces brasiliensis]|uniref:hypothetical protein n=1 Tax=Streptomyces brasiliensis TaxID=1954 RepID=UPI001E5030F2|nr:hypothetical protein [Streptomyces brasiliensis]